MQKGVSPIVAEVLLIALVITTSMGIWYWMGQYTQVPIVKLNLREITITACNQTHVLVRNVGAYRADKVASVIKQNVGSVGFIDLNGTPLDTGSSTYVKLINTSSSPLTGTFFVIDSNYREYVFVCT